LAVALREAIVSQRDARLLLPPKLSGAAPPNRASRATIAFLESNRPDAPRPGDAYCDDWIAVSPAVSDRAQRVSQLAWMRAIGHA
jgi:hypothetical protein